jgi:hypothetical protein
MADKPAAQADAPTVAARLDKREGRVGDLFELTVTTVGPRELPTNLPTQLELGPFEVVGGSDPQLVEKDLGDGRISRSFLVKVAAYETGELRIPAIAVTYLGRDGRVLEQRTEEVPVKITSLIANEPDAKLKDLAGPVTVMERDLTVAYVAGGLVAAGVGALLALVIRRRLRAAAARRPALPPRPPHEIALEKLDQLAKTGFVEGADLQGLYFQLSEVLRGYLGARYGVLALEMTSEELIEALRRRGPRGMVVSEIAGWLSSSDLVKFAKLHPPAAEARGALEAAIRIVEATRPRPEPQGPGPVAAPVALEGERTP